MQIDDLITLLQRVKVEKGNIEVVGSSFCGTNNSHVTFNITDRVDVDVEDLINGLDQLCLTMTLTNHSRDKIKDGVESMKRLGYAFYCSQYVENGKQPESGLSPCEWHTPW